MTLESVCRLVGWACAANAAKLIVLLTLTVFGLCDSDPRTSFIRVLAFAFSADLLLTVSSTLLDYQKRRREEGFND